MSDLMRKHEMTEEDIKLQFITPAIEGAGWDRQRQIRMEYNFTDGRVIVRGNVTARGRRKRTDYLLYYKPQPPAGQSLKQKTIVTVSERACSKASNMLSASMYRSFIAPMATVF